MKWNRPDGFIHNCYYDDDDDVNDITLTTAEVIK